MFSRFPTNWFRCSVSSSSRDCISIRASGSRATDELYSDDAAAWIEASGVRRSCETEERMAVFRRSLSSRIFGAVLGF